MDNVCVRLLVVFKFVYCIDYNWNVSSSSQLPRPGYQIAIAHWNNSIYLFGGYSSQQKNKSRQVIQFDICRESFVDHGDKAISGSLYGYSQYYSQINSKTYFLDDYSCGGGCIDTYNLINNSYTYLAIYPVKYKYVSDNGCLASYHNLLFVIGGQTTNPNDPTYLSSLQIYNISNQTWYLGPDMQTARGDHSCIVDPIQSEIYAIGGSVDMTNTQQLASIEKIYIENITASYRSSWIYATETLKYPTRYAKAVLNMHMNSIMVIGGGYNSKNEQGDYIDVYVDRIQVIHCMNGTVSFGGYLKYGVIHTAAVLVNDRVYAFGGLSNNEVLDTWQYTKIDTNVTTNCKSEGKKKNVNIILEIVFPVLILSVIMVMIAYVMKKCGQRERGPRNSKTLEGNAADTYNSL